ncbi:MAG: CPBP family intramembrane metalloprotease [Gemmatimonadota bacterium]|nr:CPBP family intramembrane metalloprotease [Gemmatimonadota bacterium]
MGFDIVTGVGLFLAMLAPFIILAIKHTTRTDPFARWPRIAFWFLFLSIIAIVLWWEQRPLSSVGIVPLTAESIGVGLVAGILISFIFPLMQVILEKFRLADYGYGPAQIFAQPFWSRVEMVLQAGIIEEMLYRSFAIERVSELTGSLWVGALIPLVFFTLAHVRLWGSGHLITVLVVGSLFTLLYVWHRDVVMCMIAHIVVDGIGFLVVPLIAQRL